jgi:hypothetical protein
MIDLKFFFSMLLMLSTIMSGIGKDMEKLEHLCTLGGNVKWHIHYEKLYVAPLRIKVKITM